MEIEIPKDITEVSLRVANALATVIQVYGRGPNTVNSCEMDGMTMSINRSGYPEHETYAVRLSGQIDEEVYRAKRSPGFDRPEVFRPGHWTAHLLCNIAPGAQTELDRREAENVRREKEEHDTEIQRRYGEIDDAQMFPAQRRIFRLKKLRKTLERLQTDVFESLPSVETDDDGVQWRRYETDTVRVACAADGHAAVYADPALAPDAPAHAERSADGRINVLHACSREEDPETFIDGPWLERLAFSVERMSEGRPE